MHPRVFQYVGIILMCALFGGGYWYWQNTQAAGIMTDSRPDFEAPLMTSLDLQEGTGIATYSRADGADRRATVTDFEGLIRPVKNGEARFEGARRVENLNPKSEADSGWTAGGTTPPTVSTSVSYGGKTAVSATFPTGVNGYAASRATGSTFSVKLNSQYISNYMIAADRALTGGESITVYVTGMAGLNSVTFSTAKQLTTSWVRYASGVSTNSAGDGSDYFTVMPGSNLSTPITIYLTERQTEEVTGQANQNPSEYVSTNVKTAFPYHGAGVDGVKYFATRNGNTVASNVVTEATGAAIPSATLKGYLAEGSRTNLAVRSEELASGPWGGLNVTVSTDSVSAPSGLTTADTMTETSAVATQFQRSQSLTISSGSTYTISAFVKRGAGSGRHMRLELSGAIHGFRANFNADTGAVASSLGIGSGTVVAAGSVAYPNGWYRFSVTGVASTETAVAFYYRMTESLDGPITYNGDGSSSFYVWGAQLENASFASSYIPTTSASVTRAADALSYPAMSELDTQGTVYAEASTQYPTTAGSYYPYAVRSSGGAKYLGLKTSIDARVFTNDSTNEVTVTSGASLATPQRIASNWSGANLKVFKNGTSSSGPYDGSMISGSIYVANSADPFFGTVKNVRLWKKALSDTQLTNLTSATDAISTSAVQQSTNLAPNGTNLLGHWSFDDGSGTRAEDFSPNGTNAGTLVGSPAWVDGRMNKAISFDGTDDYVDVGSSSSLNTTADYTISMWVYNAAGSDLYPTLLNRAAQVTNNGFFWIYTNGTNEADLNFQYADGTNFITNTFSGALGTNTWQHVMFTFDNTSKSLKLYINGNQFSTTRTLTGSLSVDDGTLYLGTYTGTATDYSFQGRLDDVRIYARALTSGEATDLYQSSAQTKVNVSQNSRMTNGLVGLWSFNGPDVSGTTAYDRSGQGNNGTLTGGPTPIIGKVGQGMSLNGINQYMLVSDPGSGVLDFGTGSFSVSVWGFHRDFTNPKSSFVFRKSSQCYLGAGRPGWDIGHGYSVNGVDVCLNDGTNYVRSAVVLDAGSRPTDFINKWIHIVIVFDRSIGRTKYYINGVKQVNEQDISTVTGSIDNTADLSVGTAYGWNVDGILDEVRIYNRALTTAEITDLYNQGR